MGHEARNEFFRGPDAVVPPIADDIGDLPRDQTFTFDG